MVGYQRLTRAVGFETRPYKQVVFESYFKDLSGEVIADGFPLVHYDCGRKYFGFKSLKKDKGGGSRHRPSPVWRKPVGSAHPTRCDRAYRPFRGMVPLITGRSYISIAFVHQPLG